MAIKEYKRDCYIYLLSKLEDQDCEDYVKVAMNQRPFGVQMKAHNPP